MASYTTNLNLKKPAGSEAVAIGDINNNMDTIDQAYGTLNSKIAKLDASTVGSRSDISSNISDSSYYTFTSSGYLMIGASSALNIQLMNGYLSHAVPANSFATLFVLKGMNVKVNNISNLNGAYFMPLM